MAIANFDRSLWRSGTSGAGFRPVSHAEIRRPGGKSPGPLEQTDVQTKGGALTDLMLRSEVVAAVLDLEPARAYRDLECFDVEEPIREIIEGKLSHVADKT